MATKPTQQNVWNTDNLNNTAPNAAKIALGWVVNEAPSSSYFNWFMNYVAKCAAYILDGVIVGDANLPGLNVTGGTGNTNGITSLGIGTGNGLQGTGGGSAGNNGVKGTGGANNGRGGYFIGGGTNGKGLRAEGTGSGVAGEFAGGATDGAGVDATSGGTAGFGVIARSAAGGGTPLLCSRNDGSTSAVGARVDGSIDFDSASNVAANVAVKNKLTKGLIPRARGNVTGGVDSLNGEGINVDSISHTSTYIQITLKQAMADTDYDVTTSMRSAGSGATNVKVVEIDVQSSTVFRIYVFDSAGSAVDPSAGYTVGFVVWGAQ